MSAMVLSPRVWLSPQDQLFPQEGLEGRRLGSPRSSILVLNCVPSSAFGDGSHPTTRLCAGAVDLHCRLESPQAVLDVGTGTGVLARIARARGATLVAATDLDPEALRATRANAALDEDAGPYTLGAAPFFGINDGPPDQWGARFDLVVANILEGPLRILAPALRASLRPGGTLFLSGFTPLQIPSLRTTFEAQGFQFEGQAQLEGWVLLKAKTTFAPPS